MTSFKRCVILTLCPYIVISFTLLVYKMIDFNEDEIKWKEQKKHSTMVIKTATNAPKISFNTLESVKKGQHIMDLKNTSFSYKTVSAEQFINTKPWFQIDRISPQKYDFEDLLNFVIHYKNFNISEPNFISNEDRQEFFAMSPSTGYLGLQPKNKLRGIIRVINNGIANEHIDCGWPSNLQNFEGKGDNVQDYILSPFLVPDSASFQHFMDGVMPKLMQAYSILSIPNVRLLIFKPRDQIIYDILEKINITRDRLVYYSDTISTSLQINSCITPPLHPILWKKARKMLGCPTNLPIPVTKSYVVLLTRAQSYNGGRNMLNFEEVTTFLQERYSSRLIVFQGNYGLANSIDIFGKSSILIGVHGGALYNLNFASEDTNIVEFLPVVEYAIPLKRIAHAIVWHMAQLLGQTYWRIHEKCDANGDMIIPIQKLRAVLDMIDHKLSNMSVQQI